MKDSVCIFIETAMIQNGNKVQPLDGYSNCCAVVFVLILSVFILVALWMVLNYKRKKQIAELEYLKKMHGIKDNDQHHGKKV